MKTLNAKRITAIAAGAALLGFGLAFAGQVTFQNVLIINGNGQPVVQVVVGHSAQPSDGVAAANIAAAIGNLAFTSVPVTATVNQAQAAQVLHATITGSGSYTLSNQQVWLNETGTSTVAGAFSFGALIGSVINRALLLSLPPYGKALQGAGQYAYPSYPGAISTTANPQASAYSGTSVPTNQTPTASYNGGGVSFTTFTNAGNDNILSLSHSQVSGLLSSSGSYSETEYLWITGFPVFNQNAGTFALLGAGGAYQVVFGKPIYIWASKGNYNQASFSMLGQDWTIINATGDGTPGVTQTTAFQGGSMYLAQSLVPLTTVYVGQNLTSGPYTVTLTDLGQPANGVSQASINLYYNGVRTNTTSIAPGTTVPFNVSGHTVDVRVNSTFAGLYAYQKWAKIQMYSNVYKVNSGQQFNSTYDKGWYVNLWWTNTTGGTEANALYSIVIYNTSAETLTPGQSFTFIQTPQTWKYTFVGETLGSSNFDSVKLTTSQATETYQNLGSQVGSPTVPSITNITEPAQLLTVSSQIPGAFTFAGQQAQSVNYILTPYALEEDDNAVSLTGTPDVTNVLLAYTNVNAANWVSTTNPITVTVKGWADKTPGAAPKAAAAQSSYSVQFTAPAQYKNIPAFYNVTGIQLSRALANGIIVMADSYNTLTATDYGPMAFLQDYVGYTLPAAGILYQQSGLSYQSISTGTGGNAILYNNGGTPTSFTLAKSTTGPSGAKVSSQYFTYTLSEIAIPTTTTLDMIAIGLNNNTAGVLANPMFIMNYSAVTDQKNNATYYNSSGVGNFNVKPGFRTERGSSYAAVTPTQVTFNLAESQDYLQFAVGPASAGTVSKNFQLFGPYGVGQATNIANVSIGAVNASVTVGAGAGVSVTGIDQVQATPSVTSADQAVLLTGLSSTAPLAVLDTSANPSSNLILVGSGYVNSLAQQLQNAYNVTVTPGGAPIVQAYGANRILIAGYYANQTTAASNQFIQQLYAQASV